ncbi:MAG: ABC-type transport auxiliary lipoprotein family protein [Deltaproteobacteria bacterium]|nr:ABC-type transport auxiliary lipoprotein family protein [Deltaproteobacteria bacterium]MDZ4347071.1 ABC-type transport auxiliary lipoprotein family protein [Candidatus Binatia bacterium]
MKTLHCKIRCCALGLLMLASGCVSIERSYPDKRYYVLEVNRNVKPSNPPGNGVLQVANIRVSPRYEDKGFVYRTSGSSYESDFYNQFLVSPAALLGEELRKGLAQSLIFRHVINSSSQLEPTHVLEGVVDALYGDFRDPGAPKAVLEMEFFLRKESASKADIVAARRYAKSVAVSGRSPDALVKGWNEALDAILSSLVADLRSSAL